MMTRARQVRRSTTTTRPRYRSRVVHLLRRRLSAVVVPPLRNGTAIGSVHPTSASLSNEFFFSESSSASGSPLSSILGTFTYPSAPSVEEFSVWRTAQCWFSLSCIVFSLLFLSVVWRKVIGHLRCADFWITPPPLRVIKPPPLYAVPSLCPSARHEECNGRNSQASCSSSSSDKRC